MVLAEIDDTIPRYYPRKMKDVPLKCDRSVLRCARDAVAASRVADDPEVDDFERHGYQEGTPEPGGKNPGDERTRGRGTISHIRKTDERRSRL